MTKVVHRAEKELGTSLPLVSRLAVPANGLAEVLWHALALGVHQAEVLLGIRQALVSRLAVPANGLGGVLWHALAIGVR